ncbi:hypothetical protein [Dysgonomonas massiliensis]|nr:hypothetical protein [Dysgonomonas massiliensis]
MPVLFLWDYHVEGATIDYAAKYKQSQQIIKDNYAYFEVEYFESYR